MAEVVEPARVERSPPTAGWRSSLSHRPRPVNWSSQDWGYYAKVRFEKYFMRKMPRDESEPFYERFPLERLNLRKIKEAV